ncbi:hypothetical protein BC351_38730 [Paenibacillus ferrarius]|uniref:DUF3500 domain-containing protein n=1 Tax=Paenibacillus ferrarius TaxID=1469647 RepID=A0A1V4HB51_9BACL|nr:DUF3500 domain-containing protein [Paenibacillus ferrarius]OPH48116.1 hypothetical protein BC351_38730 [Paenibacillus ferrarius]
MSKFTTKVTTAFDCPSISSSKVVELAKMFAATLTNDQLCDLNQDYSLRNAVNWSNYPQAALGRRGRRGLRIDTLSREQWAALDTLLAAATGSAKNKGYYEIQQILNADDYLRDHGGGRDYGRENFYIAFLGTPSDSGRWELQFGGHHLAVTNTYAAGVLVGATPSFRGIEPFSTFEYNGVSNQPQQQAQRAFVELLASFNENQLAKAKLRGKYRDLLLGPGKDWAFPTTAAGVQGSELREDQRALLLTAIEAYVSSIDDENAVRILTHYESELDSTYIGYSGSTSVSKPMDYIRIDGPSVWIEFSMHSGIILSDPHPHAVWRDKHTDYGGTAF